MNDYVVVKYIGTKYYVCSYVSEDGPERLFVIDKEDFKSLLENDTHSELLTKLIELDDKYKKSLSNYKEIVEPTTKRYESSKLISDSRDKVNVFSFALEPEDHQPSGTLNYYGCRPY